MTTISDVLLRAKHWQVFLAMAAFVGAAVGAMLGSFALTPSGQFPSAVPFLVAMELFAMSFGLWVWSLGMFLNSIVPESLRTKSSFFRFSGIYLPVYLPLFGVFFQGQTMSRNASLILISFAVIFPLHLFAMFCQVYSWYFVSKSLALAEKQQSVSFEDYLGYICALWIFPVGVWIIQPRVNGLYANATARLSS